MVAMKARELQHLSSGDEKDICVCACVFRT